MKKPAEKMRIPCFLDLRWIEEEVAVEATAQYGSLLLMSLTWQSLISFSCLLIEEGRWTLNLPCWSVFTSVSKAPSLHSTDTVAPEMKWLLLEKSSWKQVSQKTLPTMTAEGLRCFTFLASEE